MWPVRVLVIAVNAHTGSWPRTTAYMPSTGNKYVHAQLSDTGIRVYRYTGSIRAKKTVELRAGPSGPVRFAVRSPTGHPRVTHLTLTVPVNYPGATCDLGIDPGITIKAISRHVIFG